MASPQPSLPFRLASLPSPPRHWSKVTGHWEIQRFRSASIFEVLLTNCLLPTLPSLQLPAPILTLALALALPSFVNIFQLHRMLGLLFPHAHVEQLHEHGERHGEIHVALQVIIFGNFMAPTFNDEHHTDHHQKCKCKQLDAGMPVDEACDHR